MSPLSKLLRAARSEKGLRMTPEDVRFFAQMPEIRSKAVELGQATCRAQKRHKKGRDGLCACRRWA